MAKFLKKEEWKITIQQCLASGESIRAWCKENQIKYSTLMAWKKRLKISENSYSTRFIELKNTVKLPNPLILECSNVKIHVPTDFDEDLRREPC